MKSCKIVHWCATVDECGHYCFAYDGLRCCASPPPRLRGLGLSAVSNAPSRDGDAVLFNAGVRSLGSFGFCDLEFDIGGKKSRRRYVKATSPQGESFSISIKSTLRWTGLADVVRFPWSKRAAQGGDLDAVLFAVDDAFRRGATHLLGIVRNEITGRLLLARLYTLEEVRSVATQQKDACQHPFYISHRAALIIRSHNEAFAKAESIALPTVGMSWRQTQQSLQGVHPLMRDRGQSTGCEGAQRSVEASGRKL